MADVIVVGAGLAGMFAGALAARRGMDATVIARGLGGAHLGSGAIEVHGYRNRKPLPAPELDSFPPDHPYALLGRGRLAAALEEFSAICAAHGLPVQGDLDANRWLPTALGATRAACVVPASMAAGDLTRPDPIALARFPGFRDFYPELMAANLRPEAHVVDLPLPAAPVRREAYATDLARLLDDESRRAKVIAAWCDAWEQFNAGREQRITRLGAPAMLGLEDSASVLAEVQAALGAEIFEIPLLPPSVPGIRIFNALRAELLAHGGRLVLGPSVRGEVSRHRTAKVTAYATGRERASSARSIVLASGGFAHGGLLGYPNGGVRETVFDLPVVHAKRRARWTKARYLDQHPYACFGVRVDAACRPVDENGATFADNLWACGGLLAGADRLSEGSREGIALGSAYAAVESIRRAA